MRIISASRRTDLPAFFTDWFLGRLNAGFCHWANPFSGHIYRISLLPEDVAAIMFLTRNSSMLLPHLESMTRRGYRYWFNYTITGYPSVLEPHAPPLEVALDACKRTSDAIGPGFVHWRYDPILISDETPREYHLRRFENLTKALAGYTKRCYVSFASFYAKTTRNLGRLDGFVYSDLPQEHKHELAIDLAAIARASGIETFMCCLPESERVGLRQAACLDPETITNLRPDLVMRLVRQPTRQNCNCVEATDIGAFDTCQHGCAYCYATNSPAAALARYNEHDPSDSILWRPPHLRKVDLDEVAKPLSHPKSSFTKLTL